jgi:hypothetical protein
VQSTEEGGPGASAIMSFPVCRPAPAELGDGTLAAHESKKSLEVYQHLSLESVDKAYQDAVQSVGI